LDIRSDAATGKLYVLEVNAQCGLSEDENYTSIGAILRFAGESFATMTKRVIEDALRAHAEKGEWQDRSDDNDREKSA
jgi:D-alanine-D-alanine ligase